MAVLPFRFFPSKLKFYVEDGHFDYKNNKKKPQTQENKEDMELGNK